jgi:hypothetical protein
MTLPPRRLSLPTKIYADDFLKVNVENIVAAADQNLTYSNGGTKISVAILAAAANPKNLTRHCRESDFSIRTVAVHEIFNNDYLV